MYYTYVIPFNPYQLVLVDTHFPNGKDKVELAFPKSHS